MKNKKVPERMCIGCREMKDKRELVRVVKSSQGEISIDFTGKAPGRGAYICKNEECLNRAVKNKAFNRAFQTCVSEEILNTLKEELGNG